MSDALLDAGAQRCAERATALRATLAETLARDVPPDVTITTNEDGIALSGAGLVARYAADVRLYSIPFIAQSLAAGETL